MTNVIMATDFDGTLYFRNRTPRISQVDLEAIARLRSSGALYGVCTGRPYLGVLDACGNELSFDFFILTSGAEILDSAGRCLYRQCVSRDVIEAAAERFAGYDYVIQANQRLYSPSPTSEFQTRIASVDDIPGEEITGFSLYMSSEEEARRTVEVVPSLWNGTMAAYRNGSIVDLVGAGCSKGRAAEFLRRYFDAGMLCGIGDSHNDIPLLWASSPSFTFQDSPEDVRREAEYVVGSTAEAIGKVLERISARRG